MLFMRAELTYRRKPWERHLLVTFIREGIRRLVLDRPFINKHRVAGRKRYVSSAHVTFAFCVLTSLIVLTDSLQSCTELLTRSSRKFLFPGSWNGYLQIYAAKDGTYCLGRAALWTLFLIVSNAMLLRLQTTPYECRITFLSIRYGKQLRQLSH